MIPLEVVGEKNGVKSDVLSGSYQAPTILAEINRAPATPKNFKARIVGNSALMTVDVLYNSNSRAEKVFLFSSSLGISKAKAIRAEMVADKAVIELPIKVSMSGKKYPVTIYAINALGESKPLSATLSIPSLPKTPQVSAAIPKPSTPATITCIRSNQTRTFAGLKCPPGWSLP
jgi:hypothetical protein